MNCVISNWQKALLFSFVINYSCTKVVDVSVPNDVNTLQIHNIDTNIKITWQEPIGISKIFLKYSINNNFYAENLNRAIKQFSLTKGIGNKSNIKFEIITEDEFGNRSSGLSTGIFNLTNLKSERLIIFGIDGAGTGIKPTNCSNIYKLLDNGFIDYSAKTVLPSISASAWTSMLHGVPPDKHKITYGTLGLSYSFPDSSLYPSVYLLAREKWPNCKLALFSQWENKFKGIVEKRSGCDFYFNLDDNQLLESISGYFEKNDPKISFIHIMKADLAGHGYGWWGDNFYKAIASSDTLVGKIMTKLTLLNKTENTFFIVLSDHGGINLNHGGNSGLEKKIFFGCNGPGCINYKGEMQMNIVDVAAIICHVLDIDRPLNFENKMFWE